jgi:hypothetical protein
VDLSGISVTNEETDSATPSQKTVFPDGFTVPRGSVVVLARGGTRAAFESFWGVTLGTNVVFAVSDDANRGVPVINGNERQRVRSAAGQVLDGFTVRGAAGKAYQRRSTGPADTDASWTVGDEEDATPGVTQLRASDRGIFISEWSDASGTGNFIHEYVELFINP